MDLGATPKEIHRGWVMEIRVWQADARVPVTVLDISGAVNGESAPELQAESERVIKAGSRYLLFDLSEVPYISSAGFRVLAYLMVLLRKWADEEPQARNRTRGGRGGSPYLKLAGASPDVLRSLKLVGFDLYLEIYSDLQAALKAF
jgi:anti-anti-sigma factor